MKITKKEYEQYLELHKKIGRQLEQITKIKKFGFGNIFDVNERGIGIECEYDYGCGDWGTEYHDISLEELMMDYDDLAIEHERQEKERLKAEAENRRIEKEKQLKLQEARDLARYNELKIKLNK